MELLRGVLEYATLEALRRLHQALGGDAGLAALLATPSLLHAGGQDETLLERLAHRHLAGPDAAGSAACLWPSRQLLVLDRQGYAWMGALAAPGRGGEVWTPMPLRPLRRPHRRFLQVATAAGGRRWLLLDVQGRVWTLEGGADTEEEEDEEREEGLQLHPETKRLGRVRCLAGAPSHALFCTAAGGEVWEQRDDQMRRLPGMPPVVQVAAGRESSFMVDRDRRLWGCGANSWTQLGLGSHLTEVPDPMPVPVPAAAGRLRRVFCASGKLMTLHENGDTCCAGWCSPTQSPLLVPWLTGIVDMSISDCHYLVRRIDDTLASGGVFPEDGKLGRRASEAIFQPLAPLDVPGEVRRAVACTVHVPHSLTLMFDDHHRLPQLVGCGQIEPTRLRAEGAGKV